MIAGSLRRAAASSVRRCIDYEAASLHIEPGTGSAIPPIRGACRSRLATAIRGFRWATLPGCRRSLADGRAARRGGRRGTLLKGLASSTLNMRCKFRIAVEGAARGVRDPMTAGRLRPSTPSWDGVRCCPSTAMRKFAACSASSWPSLSAMCPATSSSSCAPSARDRRHPGGLPSESHVWPSLAASGMLLELEGWRFSTGSMWSDAAS